MIPSLSHATSTPRPIPHLHEPLEPLTLRQVLKESYIEPEVLQNVRRMGPFSWFESQNLASLGHRVEFINKVTSQVLETIPLKDTPITLVSLGSAGLLSERLIDHQLKKAGYQDIQWRMIDCDYQHTNYKEALNAFEEKVNPEVLSYMTEQDYLSATNPYAARYGASQANFDRLRGATILLSIDPPTALDQSAISTANLVKYMTIRGRPMEDSSKANGIYLLISKDTQKSKLYKAYEGLLAGDKVVVSSCALKLELNAQNRCEIQHGQCDDGVQLNASVKPFINKMHDIARLLEQPISLEHVSKALDKYLAKIGKQGLIGRQFLVSDYDYSLKNLDAFLKDGAHPYLVGSLEKNEINLS